MNKLNLEDVFENKDGETVSVDLSKVFFSSQYCLEKQARPQAEERLPMRLKLAERPQIADQLWSQLFKSMVPEPTLPAIRNSLALSVRTFDRQPLTLAVPDPAAMPGVRTLGAAKLPPPKTASIGIARNESLADGNIEKLDVNLPFGMPRFINIPTLRMFLRRPDFEPLLILTASGRWEVCPESHMVDLANPNIVFRVGPLTIYS